MWYLEQSTKDSQELTGRFFLESDNNKPAFFKSSLRKKQWSRQRTEERNLWKKNIREKHMWKNQEKNFTTGKSMDKCFWSYMSDTSFTNAPPPQVFYKTAAVKNSYSYSFLPLASQLTFTCVDDVILMFLLLTLNIFHTFF